MAVLPSAVPSRAVPSSPVERPAAAGRTPRGCPMADGLYLRASGEIACWGHLGDVHVLDRLDLDWLRAADSDLVEHPALAGIRAAFSRGLLPFPDLCPACPVLGDGVVPTRRPTRLDKLLIEPSYLCQLACPACFSAVKRRTRGKEPYILQPEMLQAFLDRLVADGIESVRFVHFEGRGDPMLGGHTWDLIGRVRRAFPSSAIQMTTHGGYAFDPALFSSGLDVLRFSIDGATEESYQRYRRGGRLHRVLSHLRAIRDHRRRFGSRLKVVWKYILFEWNDTREELELAARLAAELEAELLFVLAEEGTGRSKRLPDLASLEAELARIAPRASAYECLDQLGSAAANHRYEVAAHAAGRALTAALDAHRAGGAGESARLVLHALEHDPGFHGSRDREPSPRDPLPSDLVRTVLPRVRHPSTLAGLANFALELGRWLDAYALFVQYLKVGPEAPDRASVERLLVRLALLAHLDSEDLADLARHSPTARLTAESAVLAIDPGPRPAAAASVRMPVTDWVDDVVLPEALRALACLRAARGDGAGARTLLEALLDRHPADPELTACARALDAYA